MGHRVSVAKAAHLLGVDRHDLQKMIRSDDLHTFEGKVDVDELREHYPLLAMDEDSEFERLEILKRTAFSRRVSERVLPEKDDIEIRLKRYQVELSVLRERAKKYRRVLEELAQTLCDLQETDDPNQKELVTIINRKLLEELESSKL
jgi:CDP-4-dehydro-6-deoxyglucose reductase